jgi:hypothetical protein
MGHPHTHTHDDDQNAYYLDQLCTLGLSGAFAGVCIALYLWQKEILGLILVPEFHIFVFWGGIVLLGLVMVRAVSLWFQSMTPSPDHTHGADSGHHHHHDPEHGTACGHYHSHEHGIMAHDHHHDCGHAHSHEHAIEAHDHSHQHREPVTVSYPNHGHGHDHDHGWAPWRYGVLMVPVLFFLLRMPNKGFTDSGPAAAIDKVKEGSKASLVLAGGPSLLGNVTLGGVLLRSGGKPVRMDFKRLEGMGGDPEEQNTWYGRNVTVKGQFGASMGRTFNLFRMKAACCAADAIPLNVPIRCQGDLPKIESGEWVEVTGHVEFENRPGGGKLTVLIVPVLQVEPGKDNIRKSTPEFNPYIS